MKERERAWLLNVKISVHSMLNYSSAFYKVTDTGTSVPVALFSDSTSMVTKLHNYVKSKGKLHPCTGTEALYRPYGP